jgi:hypothetical protein
MPRLSYNGYYHQLCQMAQGRRRGREGPDDRSVEEEPESRPLAPRRDVLRDRDDERPIRRRHA